MKKIGMRRRVWLGAALLTMQYRADAQTVSLPAAAPLHFELPHQGSVLTLSEVPAPSGLVSHARLRYLQASNGHMLAVRNRVIAVARRASALRELAGPVRQVGALYLASASTADVNAAVALAYRLRADPLVVSAQPDLSQNLRSHAGSRWDWEHFDLGAAIGLREAWRIARGQGVKVAIIDSGIELQHPALRGVTLAGRWDVESDSPNVGPANERENHGTRVAGLIFGQRQSIGLQGVAPQAQLIAVRLVDGWTSSLLSSLAYASQAGADVINCSWTFPLMLDPVAALVQALAEGGRSGLGTLIVVSAGNRAEELRWPGHFAAHPALLAVTAVDHQGIAVGAAYGPGVFMAAPGWVAAASNRTPGGIEPLGSTSAAAAIVSGIAALMLSANPRLNRNALMQLLAQSADRREPGGFVDGRSPLLGVGRAHAGAALKLATMRVLPK